MRLMWLHPQGLEFQFDLELWHRHRRFRRNVHCRLLVRAVCTSTLACCSNFKTKAALNKRPHWILCQKKTQRNHRCSSSGWLAASWTALPLDGHVGWLLVRSAFCLFFSLCWFMWPQQPLTFLILIYLLEITERSFGDVSPGPPLTIMPIQKWVRHHEKLNVLFVTYIQNYVFCLN